MRITVVVWALSVAVTGCADWNQWGKSNPGQPKHEKPSGTDPVRLFEGAIDHSPLPAVSLATDTEGGRQERGVRATFAEGHTVSLAATDSQQIERDLRDGTLSLVDVLMTARAIFKANYKLEGAGSGAADEQIARGVHDALLQIVHAHAADCQALCAGSTAACGSRRSFGDGAPCELAGKTKDEISDHFGADWCTADFCPAMREARE